MTNLPSWIMDDPHAVAQLVLENESIIHDEAAT
jgi:hypothetical protein